MNSDKAAAVRDAVNGCPCVVDVDDTRDYNSDRLERQSRGVEVTFTGEFLRPDPAKFRPATVEQAGTIGNGDGAERPVFVVVLETLWLDDNEARSLSPELVYEAAKHDCRIRFYPPEHRLGGAVWLTDHWSQQPEDTNGDRCPDCGGTYFKLRDGAPECARCGTSTETEQTTLTEATH